VKILYCLFCERGFGVAYSVAYSVAHSAVFAIILVEGYVMLFTVHRCPDLVENRIDDAIFDVLANNAGTQLECLRCGTVYLKRRDESPLSRGFYTVYIDKADVDGTVARHAVRRIVDEALTKEMVLADRG